MAEILCPSCNKRLRVNPQSKTRRMRCPVCQAEMSLSVSGETVTARILAGAPLPEPPPLPPPPAYAAPEPEVEVYQGYAEEPADAASEPQAFEEPAPPQPEIQLSMTPRTSPRSPLSKTQRRRAPEMSSYR